MSDLTNLEVLRLFKKRFNETVLYELNITVLLEAIGLDRLKEYFKNTGYKLVKIKDKT